MRAKVQNQAAAPTADEPAPKENNVLACGKAFPGKTATPEQIEEWRKHPGWMEKNDPWLNGQIENPVKKAPAPAPARAPAPAAEQDDAEPERTAEFELSRMLDEAMREVYKHLHGALTDQTYNGQELKLSRAYKAITQFQLEHAGEFTQLQTASIACTRDQVAKLQCDLAARGERINVEVQKLEASFQRMNQWRLDDDPMKTMKLAQYIDEKKRVAHAETVAKKGPPAPIKTKLQSGMEVNVTEVVRQIEMHGRSNGGFNGKGLWFGVDHSMLCMNGELSSLSKNPPFIACKTEGQWKDLLGTLDQLQLVCDTYKLPGEQAYTAELTEVRHDGVKLVVQYWVLALDDRKYEDARHKDPRANLLPEVLSGKRFDGNAIVQVWAQIKQLNEADKPRTEMDGLSTRKEVGEPHEEHDAPRCSSPDPMRSPRGKRSGMLAKVSSESDEEYEDEVDPNMVQWSQPIVTAGGVSTLRHEANKLMERAKRVAELGDHKTAYELMAQGYALRQQADDTETAATPPPSIPAADEPKVYKPEVQYQYPSGEVRIIEAGYYTETEHLSRSMEEQTLWAAVVQATEAGIAKVKITPDQMSKYEGAISRSMSASESITAAEQLRDTIAHKAERARNVMSVSRESSKHASPRESPKLGSSPPPEGAISFKLPDNLVPEGAVKLS